MNRLWYLLLWASAVLLVGIQHRSVEADPLVARLMEDPNTRLSTFFEEQHDPFWSFIDTPEEEHWFNQRVDHFGFYKDTFPQLYFMNDTHYKPGGPVYLYSPGESSNRVATVKRGFLLTLAKETNGLVFSLEHRYYGKSNPVPDLSPRNMRYLSVAQALEDTANFILTAPLPAAVARAGPRDKLRWIVVGGSYAGNLAAWMRLKYPELVFAAYSSSGPVRAKYDYYEYDLAVRERLPCRDQVQAAIEQVDAVLASDDADQIALAQNIFGLQALDRVADFAGALVDQISYLVQYYAPPLKGKADTIEDFCQYFSNHTQPIDALAAATKQYISANKYNVLERFDTYRGASNYTLGQAGRSWFYQTCTEFGYWQTAPRFPMPSLRSKLVDIEYNEGPCRAFFGSQVRTPVDTDRINFAYGADTLEVSRVYFVNGEFDPWRKLSVSSREAPPRENTPDVRVQVVPGASHCYDLRQPTPETDSPALQAIRSDIVSTFQRWLGEPTIP